MLTGSTRVFLSALAIILFVCNYCATTNADEIWSENVAESIEAAKADNKDVMILFTGSDWCPPCMQLEKDVLSQPDFFEKVREKYVLVICDFPQKTEQSEELKKQNNEWQSKFGVAGYPTIVLVDSEQRPYAFSGSREGSAGDYVTHIDSLYTARKNREELFEKARAAEGLEKAQLLDQALSQMTTEIAEVYYESVIEEIVELDKSDVAGLRTKYYAAKDRQLRKELMTDIVIAARLRKPEDAIAYIDERMTEMELPADVVHKINLTKLGLFNRLDDFESANTLLDKMIAMPELTVDGLQRLVIKKVYLLVGQDQKDEALSYLDQEIKGNADNLLLVVAKGELLDSMDRYEEAIGAFDKAMVAAATQPDLLVELSGAKADALWELGKQEEGLKALDEFASNLAMPSDLRAESLLHKAMMLREMGMKTAAIRAEAKAMETVQSPSEKSEFQKLVEQIRTRKSKKDDSSE